MNANLSEKKVLYTYHTRLVQTAIFLLQELKSELSHWFRKSSNNEDINRIWDIINSLESTIKKLSTTEDEKVLKNIDEYIIKANDQLIKAQEILAKKKSKLIINSVRR